MCSKPGEKVRGEGRNSGAGGISTENGMEKCSKTNGMVFGEIGEFRGGENFEKKKSKGHKCHPKMNLCRKFQIYRTI